MSDIGNHSNNFEGALTPLPQEHFDFVGQFDPSATSAYKMARLASSNLVKRNFAELEARTDYLTGLPNERQIDESIETAIAKGVPFGVIAFDLDNFKSINDTKGHEEGDRVLKEFARTMKKTMRREDILGFIGRKSGDEFWAVLPLNAHTPKGEDMPYSERFSRAMTRIGVAASGMVDSHPEWQECGFDVSMGGAAWTPSQHLTREELMKAADESMMRQKELNHVENGSYR